MADMKNIKKARSYYDCVIFRNTIFQQRIHLCPSSRNYRNHSLYTPSDLLISIYNYQK